MQRQDEKGMIIRFWKAEELGEDGRILVRESGTEPVIRVMVEARKDAICREMVQRVIDVMDKEGLILS